MKAHPARSARRASALTWAAGADAHRPNLVRRRTLDAAVNANRLRAGHSCLPSVIAADRVTEANPRRRLLLHSFFVTFVTRAEAPSETSSAAAWDKDRYSAVTVGRLLVLPQSSTVDLGPPL